MSSTLSDRELLALWRAGDGQAGSALVKRHFDAIHRFFANKAHGHEDDLIQQTFMACVEARDAFRGESSFRAYLFGLARFQLLTHYRKHYRGPGLDFTTRSFRDLRTSPTGALARHDAHRTLEYALQQIPMDQQIALELTYWEDLSAVEIAQALGIPENTVYSRLRRAKEHLRRALEQLGDEASERDRAIALLVGPALGEEARAGEPC
jgi:RNA polymerase sigma factor (sigma-70 family)